LLDRAQGVVYARAKLPLNPFASTQSVTVFAAVSALVFPHQDAGFFSNITHFLRAILTHI